MFRDIWKVIDFRFRYWFNIRPKEWWAWHHRDCGTAYRGCHPSKCPKNQWEETGVWKYKW
jgi:hypothetical protein